MIHGWVVVDKPLGMSSAMVVAKIRRLFKIKKVGHGGTLDPMATGVLPIALGEATKTLSYVLNGRKAYRFEVKWGEARTTDDREGEVITTSNKRPTEEEIQKVLPLFKGKIQQVPPPYSALKIDGKRAYALAREGKEVILEPREVEIESLALLQVSPDSALFEVTCSKGTYVRSLGRDLALALRTVGYILSLRRLMAGPFQEKSAILLDSLLQIGHNKELKAYVLPLQDALVDILALEIQGYDAEKLRQGQIIPTSHVSDEEVILVLSEGNPQALAKVRAGKIVPIRVFNLD
ncbi:MAG: tRNA pseudouridine(55) synthase TruB [Alphaproteobacteria bacterium]|nr:tRNA pseudouridine(55) synthase TruB [Alphaproteobacteria bacterium]